MNEFGLSLIDVVIIVVYVFGIIWYGLAKGRKENSEDYFLGGRSMTWPIVGIALFAANIGSNTLIGLSSSAYQGNVAVYNYEWMAAVVLVFFALFFLPFYLRSRVYTMPEFLERRFDSRCRYLFSVIMIFGNVVIDMASGLYAGNLILKIIFPEVDSWIIIALLAASAAAYTIPGGLASAVHTEVVQAMLLVVGSCILTWFCFREVGGWQGMMDGLNSLYASGSITSTPDEVLSLVKPASDPNMPWTGLLFGVPLLGFYFWVNNQFMVQRVLSAKDLNHGRWGALFAGLLKLPVLFIMVIPGVVALVLFKELDIGFLGYYIEGEAGQVLCSRLDECPNMTYPVLIYKLLPVGILGLVIAGILAAMASSISATLNSASTLITMDFVKKINPRMEGKGLVRSGQITTVCLVILAAAWAPQIENFSSLWTYLQLVLAYISPPIAAAFLAGLFIRRVNALGAFVSMLSGYVLVVTFIIARLNGFAPELIDVHFLIQVPVLLAFCIAVNFSVSCFWGQPATPEVIENYTWSLAIFRAETQELAVLRWYQNYRILSIGLLAVTATIVIAFW